MIKEVPSRIKNKNHDFSVLDDVLETLRFRGSIFFRSELASPWGLTLDNLKRPRFHISLKGDFVVGVGNGKKAIAINEMDIVMLPHGDMHWIADKKESERISSSIAGNACELGNPRFQQGTITNKVICGLVHFDDEMFHPILDSLPSVLHFSNIYNNDSIWMTVKQLEAETSKLQGNRNLIVDRLTEVLFLQLMHKFIEETDELSGFLAGLRDQRVHKILKLIHQQPQSPWTLESLGVQAGMSKATLVRQFKIALGMPPMTYISQWRMIKAYNLLKYSNRSVEFIAESVGFSSARTLNKAFQREFGFTPKDLRRKLNDYSV
ncbi:MAG: AraC-like DNA-binding protein [Cocleimonas sp.]|jgi:AraC-like DNA-binding protein